MKGGLPLVKVAILSFISRLAKKLIDCPTQVTLITWICQLCSMTNTSEKYERTQQRNLLLRNATTQNITFHWGLFLIFLTWYLQILFSKWLPQCFGSKIWVITLSGNFILTSYLLTLRNEILLLNFFCLKNTLLTPLTSSAMVSDHVWDSCFTCYVEGCYVTWPCWGGPPWPRRLYTGSAPKGGARAPVSRLTFIEKLLLAIVKTEDSGGY